jgi:hypothetical protein
VDVSFSRQLSMMAGMSSLVRSIMGSNIGASNFSSRASERARSKHSLNPCCSSVTVSDVKT